MSRSLPWRLRAHPTGWRYAVGAGLLAVAATASGSPSVPDGKALDFDALEVTDRDTVATLTRVKPPLPKIPAELSGGAWSALRLPRERGYVQPYASCPSGKECTVGVALTVKQGKGYVVKAKLDLPTLPAGVELTNMLPLGLLDGASAEELLVRYEGVRKGAGAQSTQWLAIVHISTMTLALLHELESWGNSRTEAACGFDVYRLDLNADCRSDLRFVRSCRCPKSTPSCAQSPSVIEEFLATPEHRFTLRPAVTGPK